MEESKSEALKLIKERYEDFYNSYAATAPEKVNRIRGFLHWLKTATEKDVSAEEKTFSARKCAMNAKVEYFWQVGGPHFTHAFDLEVIFTNDETYASYFGDVYFSTEATSKVVPGNIDQVATEEAKNALYKADKDAVYHRCNYSYDITDPYEDKYLSCVLTYPHETKGTTENKQLNFIVWNGKAYIKNIGDLGEQPANKTSGGCYIATAVYGSYDCPQVWTLRRYRDDTLASTRRGRAFIRIYYAISPLLVKLFGKTKWFKRIWKRKLDKKVSFLNANGVENTPYDDKDWKRR